ncbi:MAG: hypothetical protein JWP32_1305 [Schumannella sp.]|nr:hypothetical protein [Schumannella sp.]
MTVTPILTRSLKYGGIVSAVVAVVAGLIGYLVSGVPGLLGALVGAGLSAVFLGLTAVSMLVGGRAARGDGTSPVFFGVVLGAFGLKLVLFVLFALWLRTQPWMDARVFAFTAIAAVVGSLIGDLVAFARARVPYVSDVRLPGEPDSKP